MVVGVLGEGDWDDAGPTENSLFPTSIIRVARLQNEIAPEKLLIRYEKGFEKRAKRSENDPKRVRNVLSPSSAA